MKNRIISEEVLKMQKRAGIITEGQYRKLVREFSGEDYQKFQELISKNQPIKLEIVLANGNKEGIITVKDVKRVDNMQYTATLVDVGSLSALSPFKGKAVKLKNFPQTTGYLSISNTTGEKEVDSTNISPTGEKLKSDTALTTLKGFKFD